MDEIFFAKKLMFRASGLIFEVYLEVFKMQKN